MANQKPHARLTVDEEELNRLNRIMNMKPADFATGSKDEKMKRLIRETTRRIGRDTVLYSTETWFPDGVTAEVSVYPPKDKEFSAYAKAVLYDAQAKKVASTTAKSRLDGKWLLLDNENKTYHIDIKGAPRMKEQETPSKHFSATVAVEYEELARLNRIMDFHDRQQDLPELDASEIREFTDSLAQKKEHLFEKEIPFPDGTHAELLVVPADYMEDRAFAQAFLYDADGVQIGFTEPYFNLDQKWTLESENGTTYTIDVQEKKHEIDKTPLGKELKKFRDMAIYALSIPEIVNQRAILLNRRGEVYEVLTHDLPQSLDAIVDRMAQRDPKQPMDLAVGNYLYTGHMDCAPVMEAEKKETEKLIPALRTFVHKIQSTEDAFYDAHPEWFPDDELFVDVMILDSGALHIRQQEIKGVNEWIKTKKKRKSCL